MDGYYVPTSPLGQANTGSLSGPGIAAQMPQIELPEVGSKMLLVIHNYGGVSVTNVEGLQGGLDVVEVEVTAIKKSKTTLE